MRIAIFSPDRESRYVISRLAEEALLRRGILPEVVLFPTIGELAEKSLKQDNPFNLAFISGTHDTPALHNLCRYLPVILFGEKDDGVSAYDVGARYYLEGPVDTIDIGSISKALARCLC